MHLYVLLLENNKYYVGTAEDIGLRLWTHFKMSDKTGSAWTKKHKPVSVIHCSKIEGNMEDFKRIEKQATLRLAKLKGFSSVRGGGYTLTTDNYPSSWDDSLVNIRPADMDSMAPICPGKLKELMVGKYQLWLKQRREGIEKKKAYNKSLNSDAPR